MVITKKQRQAISFTNLLFLLYLFLIPSAFLICTTTATTTNLYSVISGSEVPVRSGQGSKYKILTLLRNEETVTALEDAGYWIKIRTATGNEGWMLKRYLSNTPSIDDAFTLPTKSDQIIEQAALPEKSVPLGEKNLQVAQSEEKIPAEKAPSTLSKITDSLPAEPTLKEPAPKANESVEELKNKLAAATLENKELRENERLKWFLAGGGVLFVGWVIGLITCRSRKRKPSLL
jgi:SH3 domain protein